MNIIRDCTGHTPIPWKGYMKEVYEYTPVLKTVSVGIPLAWVDPLVEERGTLYLLTAFRYGGRETYICRRTTEYAVPYSMEMHSTLESAIRSYILVLNEEGEDLSNFDINAEVARSYGFTLSDFEKDLRNTAFAG